MQHNAKKRKDKKRKRKGATAARGSSSLLSWIKPSTSSKEDEEADAPRLWNSLPPDIRNIDSLSLFLNHLKTHLFTQAYDDGVTHMPGSYLITIQYTMTLQAHTSLLYSTL